MFHEGVHAVRRFRFGVCVFAVTLGCGGSRAESSDAGGRFDASVADATEETGAPSADGSPDGSPDPSGDAAAPDGGGAADGGGPVSTATSFLVNPAHTNAVVDPLLRPPLTLAWSFDILVDEHAFYPLIAGGMVYIVLPGQSANATLVAYDAKTGATRWGPVDLGATFVAGHAYDGGRIFVVGTSDSSVRAYDGATGATLWSRSLPAVSAFTGPPTAYRGLLYVVADGEVDAIEEATGATAWSTLVPYTSSPSPAVTDDGVYVSYGCAEAYAFDPGSGAVLWHHPGCGNDGTGGLPAVFQGRVYLMDDTDGPTILDGATGQVVGQFVCVNPPAFDGTRGFFNERTPLYGVNLPAVRNAWSFSGDGELNLAPIVAGGTVYVVSDSGKIFGVDEGSGSETWQAQVRGLGAPGAMAAGGGVLVVAGSDGYSGISAYTSSLAGDAGVSIGRGPDGGPVAPEIVSAAESAPETIVLDATSVYWTNYNSGEVRRIAKTAGAQATTISSIANTNPWGIAVDSQNVYWTEPNIQSGGTSTAVREAPLTGGPATVLVPDPATPQAIVAGAGAVYWIDPNGVSTVSVDGGAPQTFAGASNVSDALAIDAVNLYWSTSDAVYQAPLSGGTPTAIGPSAAAITVDTTSVYLALNDSLGVGEIMSVPIGGGAQTALATGRTGGVVAIAVDADNVYWIEGSGTIQQGAVAAVPKGGGLTSVLATGLTDPSAIAVDDSGVYFTNEESPGQIERIPKGP